MKERRRLKIRLLLGATVAALAMGVTAQAQATNVVPNPGFEQPGCVVPMINTKDMTPIICGWQGYGVMTQVPVGPEGHFSMALGCGFLGCDPHGYGWVSLGAGTSLAFCVAIGPGSHPASFWFLTDAPGFGAMFANFFHTPHCTGTTSLGYFEAATEGGGWQQAFGSLDAPSGTESAQFSVSASKECEDYCSFDVGFDAADVEDTVVLAGP